MFHVGQKVVCVRAAPVFPHGNMSGLQEGPIYTIRWCGMGGHPDATGLAVRLNEIIHGEEIGEDFSFDARRFRPVVERKTDISVFTKILDGVKKLARERA